MSWEGQEKDTPKEAPKETPVESKPEVTEEPKAAAEAVDTPKEVEAETPEPVKVEPEEKSVPQEIVGRALKAQREKYRALQNQDSEAIRILQEENRRLKEQYSPEPENEEDQKISQKVREEFLLRQDAYGREKYGKDYHDAIELIALQNDPLLVKKIQEAATPADTLMREAVRIAQELQLGATPEEREKKKEQLMEERIRKKIEAELAEKIKAKGNQPTDVQSVRAAGGDVRPIASRDTWASGRGTLPR